MSTLETVTQVRGIVERNWPHLVGKFPPRDE
jgi:hypothetical protein